MLKYKCVFNNNQFMIAMLKNQVQTFVICFFVLYVISYGDVDEIKGFV